jgi:hypothetical protein
VESYTLQEQYIPFLGLMHTQMIGKCNLVSDAYASDLPLLIQLKHEMKRPMK